MRPASNHADVVVVGGGGSGLAAAISAAERGARVILLEKTTSMGGTTALSVGSITASRTRQQRAADIEDTPDAHFEDMDLFLGELVSRENRELRRVLVDNVPDTLEWLMGLGLRFHGPMAEPPHSKPRMHNVLPNSRAFPHFLGRAARRLSVDIRLNARAERLEVSKGEVVGVQATIGGRETRIVSNSGVILATGDFSASRAFKGRFNPQIEMVPAINDASTGDGHAMADGFGSPILNGDLAVGPSLRFAVRESDSLMRRLPPFAILTAPMQFALRTIPIAYFRRFVMSFLTTSLAPEPALFNAGAVLVNREGQRFSDERTMPARHVAKQTSNEAFIVFDEKIGRRFEAWPNFISTAPGVAYAYLNDYRRTRKDIFFTAHSVADLAHSIGLPAASLAATFEALAYDPRRRDLPALSDPPFYALGPVSSWVVLSEGGLAVSTDHEVLDGVGKAVPGLYAVGSAGQGGLVLAGHGHHLGWAFTSGRRAGISAAERARLVPRPDLGAEAN